MCTGVIPLPSPPSPPSMSMEELQWQLDAAANYRLTLKDGLVFLDGEPAGGAGGAAGAAGAARKPKTIVEKLEKFKEKLEARKK